MNERVNERVNEKVNKIIPPTPNLAGDDVRFARYDKDGKPISWGHMHRADIERLLADGDNIRIVNDDWQPPIIQPDLSMHAQFTIAQTLQQTDKYFTADASDNIDSATQAKWRQYRRALRDAAKKNSLQDVMAAIPNVDPKGVDPFQKFR